MEEDYKNPSQLLLALIDTMECPTCIVDETGNMILNSEAKELQESGLEIKNYVRKIKKDSETQVFHHGKKYSIHKQDINHGTNSYLCKITLLDDPIARLTESSKKLKKVLSAL